MTAYTRTAEPPLRGRLRLLAATATVLFATVLLLGSGAPPAHAHTDLLGAWPPAGVTDRAVDQVRLQFAEPLAEGLAQVVVTGPQGSATAGGPVITGAEVVVPLEALTRAGTYRVDYRVVSSDGHVVVGGYDVTVSAAAVAKARQQAREGGEATEGPTRGDRAPSATGVAAGAGVAAGVAAGAATGVTAAQAAGDPSTDGPPPASGATPIASDPRALAVLGGGVLLLIVLLGIHFAKREPAGSRSRRTS